MILLLLTIASAQDGNIVRVAVGAGLDGGPQFVHHSNGRFELTDQVALSTPMTLHLAPVSAFQLFGGASNWGFGIQGGLHGNITLGGGLESVLRTGGARLAASGRVSREWNSGQPSRLAWEGRLVPTWTFGPVSLSLSAAIGQAEDEETVIAVGSVPDFNGSGWASSWSAGVPTPTFGWRFKEVYEVGLYVGATVSANVVDPVVLIGLGQHW